MELEERKSRSQGQTQGVMKVPQPPLLLPIEENDNASKTKRKTRSMIATEAGAKEARDAKKKTRRNTKCHKVTMLG